MSFTQPLARAAFWFTFASALAIVVSIAASQILLALALATLLVSGTPLRLPPIRWPLALFLAGTVISLLLSEDPSAGRPQLRKFFVFFVLLVVYSTFRSLAEVRWLYLGWAAAGTAAGGLALVQFWRKLQEAHQHGQAFYEYYVADRITGFMSHWMTFGGQQMIVLLLLSAFLLFSPRARRRALALGLAAAGVLGASLLLGMTRSIWVAMAGAALYLVWHWKPRLLLAAPVLAVLFLWLGPASLRTRLTSIYQPREELDSNQHRIICWRTGWEMIRAHPWFGLGPEIVRLKFEAYVPADIPRRPDAKGVLRADLPTGWYGHLHNIYIHYAAERGIPVLLVLLWLLGKILWDFASAARRLPPGPSDEKFILHGAAAAVIAILISGIFELNLGDSEVLTAFLAVVASAYVAVEKVRAEPRLG